MSFLGLIGDPNTVRKIGHFPRCRWVLELEDWSRERFNLRSLVLQIPFPCRKGSLYDILKRQILSPTNGENELTWEKIR